MLKIYLPVLVSDYELLFLTLFLLLPVTFFLYMYQEDTPHVITELYILVSFHVLGSKNLDKYAKEL